MFTNWLTTTSTTSSSSNTNSVQQQQQHHHQQPYHHSANPLPPDIVIEIGPPPYAKFAAHCAIICAHSGYFRAVLNREHNEPVIYLPNVTAEQFAPLLTYMYTGFLDLTIENIFGVLLATHILHMPRALEICRSFLSRSQQDGYLGGFFVPTLSIPPPSNVAPPSPSQPQHHQQPITVTKIIRPIPNKATIETGLSFISTPIISNQILLPSHDTKFRKISERNTNSIVAPSPIEIVRERSPLPSTSKNVDNKKIVKTTKLASPVENDKAKLVAIKPVATVLQSQQPKILEVNQNVVGDPKTIIDIASCDGPVRFRRVLNDAYGRLGGASKSSTPIIPSTCDEGKQRSHINTSFHQQMARNISERNNNNNNNNINSEESENSEDTNNTNILNKDSNEFYVCVYCKHTFKSQYCYQKHAKRHINPLSMDNSNDSNIDIMEEKSQDKIITSPSKIECPPQAVSVSTTSSSTQNAVSKREVRPLDMNVQYYPCKTCGCKFPSYYFVHKHRKMCHADEENP